MRLFGLEITRTKQALQSVYDRASAWFPVIREPFTGAWQRNMELRPETVLTYNAVYACVALIAADIAKVRLRLVEQDDDGIWSESNSPAFSPVLRKPNRYQNRIEFIQQWVISKLLHGNTYILKERDLRGVVVAMYVLDPTRCKALVAPDGAVFYDIAKDNLSGVEEYQNAVPASEVIHDKMVPLFHPLCGVSPITACGLAASQGMSIQRQSTAFFANGARPSVLLTAAGAIGKETADRLKAHWEENYNSGNAGRVAVLGDGLTAEVLTLSAADSQLIEQLKWSAETVCSCFHVPPYMVGVGQMPSYNNIEALSQQYYSQCLQSLIESIELCLDEGLGLTSGAQDKVYGTEFDLDDLLRMDTATQIKTYAEAVKGGLLKPNEGRKKLNAGPVEGGNEVYLQQQNFSLSALAKRDAKEDPFGTAAPAAPAEPPANDNQAEQMQAMMAEVRKGFAHARL